MPVFLVVRIQLLTAISVNLCILTIYARCSLVGVLHVRSVVRRGDWFGVVWHLVPSCKKLR